MNLIDRTLEELKMAEKPDLILHKRYNYMSGVYIKPAKMSTDNISHPEIKQLIIDNRLNAMDYDSHNGDWSLMLQDNGFYSLKEKLISAILSLVSVEYGHIWYRNYRITNLRRGLKVYTKNIDQALGLLNFLFKLEDGVFVKRNSEYSAKQQKNILIKLVTQMEKAA